MTFTEWFDNLSKEEQEDYVREQESEYYINQNKEFNEYYY